MSLNDIVFNKGQGGLGRPLAGEDHISGLLLYSGNLPSGFNTNVKSVLSVADAEALGIVNDFSDCDSAFGGILFSELGDNGDYVNVKVNDINGVIDLGTYTKSASETTIAQQATALAALISAGKYQHGYDAFASSETCVIVAPKRNGIYLNSGSHLLVTTNPGASIAVDLVVTQFSDGTYSEKALWHYHISEYFRLQPKGKLFIGIFPVPGTYTFEELTTIQTVAEGKIRQFAIYHKGISFNTNYLNSIQAVCNTNAINHKPFSVLYGADLIEFNLSTDLPNLQNFTDNNVSAVISQDAGGLGAYLYKHAGISITTVGALLGAVSLSKVSDDIAWVGKYNISNGVECDTIGFANGQNISAVSQNLLNQLDNYKYIFLIKYVGIAGSYFNDSHTATIESSDYAYIENNRTIDKAIRGVYASLLPSLNSPLVLNSDGTLTDNTVAYFESQAGLPLAQMVRDVELSSYSVVIDPSQDVLGTGNVNVTIKLLPIGVARQITVNIGFTTSIA